MKYVFYRIIQDSVIFKTQYHKEDKTGKAKVLKAKFSVSQH